MWAACADVRTPRLESGGVCQYQVSRFGLEFIQKSNLLTSEFTNHWHYLIDAQSGLRPEEIDAMLKKVGYHFYQQYISVIRGELSEEELLKNWWKAPLLK